MRHNHAAMPAPVNAPLRVAVYARVSTSRQAEADLSIPDQIHQAKQWCDRQGGELTLQYIEPGASGTDENRPVFSEMIDHAKSSPKPFDVILVHSFSRFARDHLTYAIAKMSLNKAGVQIQSITQPLNDDPTGQMVEAILVTFDAYASKENAKHTSRAMIENARQGFWNGSRPPFGYDAVEAERRGEKIKKKLAVNDEEAQVVKRIFGLYLGAEGRQYGVKAIAAKLNGEGVTFRGKPFMISNVHRILTSETYTGRHWFNVSNSKSGRLRPQGEWVATTVPAIISAETFETIQLQLADRAPQKTPARVVNNPTLLTGIAVCGNCGAGMTLRTGKGYRYYACAGRAQKGPTRCGGCAVSMPKVDQIVLSALADHIFTPARLVDLVSGHLDQARKDAQQQRSQAGQLKAELTEVEGAITRLIGMVEIGMMALDDPSLRERLTALKGKRTQLTQQIETASVTQPAPNQRLTEAKLTKLAAAIRQALLTSDPPMQKAYVKMFVDKVVITREQIEITGPKDMIAKAALSDLPTTSEGVITFVRSWRPVGDSNPCRRRERAVSWASRRTGRGRAAIRHVRRFIKRHPAFTFPPPEPRPPPPRAGRNGRHPSNISPHPMSSPIFSATQTSVRMPSIFSPVTHSSSLVRAHHHVICTGPRVHDP
jgi:site-specific DNA recombinase